MLICCNGQIVEESKLSISDLGRTFWYGDGVFTTIRVEQGKIIAFDEHIKRLRHDASLIDIDCPKINEVDLEHYLIKQNCQIGSYRLKLMLVPQDDVAKPIWDKNRKAIYIARVDPYEMPSGTLRVKVFPKALELPVLSIKSNSYAHRIWLKKWAIENGYDDALCLDKSGKILELATSAIFWRARDSYYTPDPSRLPIINSIGIQCLPFKVEPIVVSLSEVPDDWEPYCCNALNPQQKISEIIY